MNKTLTGAFVALALASATATGATMAGAQLAHAADVTFNLGDVAIGYNDGYWDHDHQWHKWQNTQHRQAYQKADGAEYHATAHTRAPNQGWHEAGDRR